MKKFYFAKFVIVFIGVFILVTASAQNFHLVKDINPYTDANPSNLFNPTNLDPGLKTYGVFNGVAYFSADDGINGIQLWCSDGTANGTRLVKIVSPNSVSTSILNIVGYSKGVLFTIPTYTGIALWTSDGTEAGTKKLKDISSNGYGVTQFTLLNNYIYFVNSSNLYEDQLWRTDGTDTGTVMTVDCYTKQYNYGYGIQNMAVFKGMLYFSFGNDTGVGLWHTDSSGTALEFNNLVGEGFPLTVVNDTLFFMKLDTGTITDLWKTDGTVAGTSKISGSDSIDYNVSLDGAGSAPFPAINHTIFFSAKGTLLKYNPQQSSSAISITKINPETAQPYIQNLISLNDSLIFFTAYDNALNEQLWCSNGTLTGTVMLKSIPGAMSLDLFQNFRVANNVLYFSCYTNSNGYELYSTDGTIQGTKIIKDINSGIYSSNPANITPVNSTVIFNATDGVHGYELWKTDGTANGTVLLKDINQTTTASSGATFFGRNYLAENSNQLLFGTFDDLHGIELWQTNGTSAGTFLKNDAIPGYFSGLDYNELLTKFNKEFYFFSLSLTDSLRLWKTDSTSASATPIQSFATGFNQASLETGGEIDMAATDTLLYFLLGDGFSEDLWVNNGQSPARTLKKSVELYPSNNSRFFPMGNIVFFVNYDGTNGAELWKSDGTINGTQLIKDINPGTGSAYPANLLVFNNKLYFTASDGSNNYLWTSDGTASGTAVLKDITVSQSAPFTVSNNKLYFNATTASSGTELWETDGTEAGTYQVKDIYPGTASSNVSNMLDVNGTLFFTANDGVHGSELWKSNGSALTTMLVKDITPGSGNTSAQYLTNGNGLLYFVVNDTMYQSNGSDSGTGVVKDPGLNGLSGISYLVSAGDKLYFSAYTYKYGYELYVGEANSTLPVTLLSFTGQWAKKDAQLTWVTTNELNNNHFNVQRSLTGTGFTTIGSVKADGDATTRNSYNYTDVNAASLGSNYVYYRLQQVDNDGKFVYTNIIRLDVSAINVIAIAPNPAQKTANIISSNDILGAEITVTDMGGHIVYTTRQNLSAGTPTPLNISGLAAGVYNVSVQSSNNVKQQCKLVVR